jgi:hypothetical protein
MPYGTVNADLMTTSDGISSAGLYGFKNIMINGDMRIDQRNAGASITPTDGTYTVDRWVGRLTQTNKYTVQQNAASVTPPVGFTNYLGVTSSSAYSVTSSDSFSIQQKIEGLNIADLAWGTANAATVTLSFWVRSSLTGTFGGSILNSAGNRSYPFSYTINSANTWEKETITIAGDTSGTWLTTNGIGLHLSFGLGQGSTVSGTAGSWSGSTFLNATGATSVVGTNGATWYVTGVQLEKGSTATSFDYRPYGTEFSLCQRYLPVIAAGSYVPAYSYSTTAAYATATLQVPTRVAPTGITTTVSGNLYALAIGISLTNITFSAGSTTNLLLTGTVASGLTAGQGNMLYTINQILGTGCEL